MERPRDRDLQEVFRLIAASKNGLSKAEIQKKTNLPHLAVQTAVRTLVERGFIDITPRTHDDLPMDDAVSIIQGRFCVIGLKILPSEVLGLVTDLRCEVLPIGADGGELTAVRNLPDGRHDVESVVRAVAELTQELVEQIPERYSVLGTGVELGGHVKSGEVVYSPNLQWRKVPLRQRLEEVLRMRLNGEQRARFGPRGFQVVIENDANALAVVSQWFGAGNGRTSFALVLVGDGVGCGLVINNELVRGFTGMAGEIGHLVIASDNGAPVCRCQKQGCLEAIATIPTILEAVVRAKKANGEDPPATIADVVKLAEKGDKLAEEAFEVAGDTLARAISYLLNLVNPEALILETYEPKVTQRLVPIVTKHLRRYCFSTAQTATDIPQNPAAPQRGAKGAAAVMIMELLSQRLPADTPTEQGAKQTSSGSDDGTISG
jgi:predicted NBD/HSP70 family sugar kinase